MLLLLLTALAAFATAVPAAFAKPVPRLIFPVLGAATYGNDYGDPRGNGRHEGIDILAPKRALAVAAEAGTVSLYTKSWRAGCMLYLHGESGTTYLYVHLNNDRTAKNDNRGGCKRGVAYPRGLRDGARVEAGDPVGYVGDSGDADGIASHLHFEVHPNGGAATSPFPHLRRARSLLFTADPRTTVDLTLRGRVLRAGGAALTLHVDRLEARPGGLTLAKMDRTLELAVPPSAVFLDPLGALIAGARIAQAASGQSAVVETAPTEATLQARLGAPLSLSAELIQLS